MSMILTLQTIYITPLGVNIVVYQNYEDSIFL